MKETKRSGIDPHTFRDLRHIATTVLAQGVHPRVAMEILGHYNIAVRMAVYLHVAGDSMRVAMSAIEEALEADK